MAARVPKFSDDFRETAREEADRLQTRIVELRARGGRWAALATAALTEAAELELKLRELDELLGRASQLRLDLQKEVLRGQELRKEAVRILIESRGLRAAIHYKEWYELMEAAGLRGGGKNPLATFLTQVSRSPLVEKVGRPGVYQINPEAAYERIRSRLRVATEQLSDANDSLEALRARGHEDEEVARATELVRDRRRELGRAERELGELLDAKRQLLDIRLAYVAAERVGDRSAMPSDAASSMRTHVRHRE